MRWFGRSRGPESEPPTSQEAEPPRAVVIPAARTGEAAARAGSSDKAEDVSKTAPNAATPALVATTSPPGRDAYFAAGGDGRSTAPASLPWHELLLSGFAPDGDEPADEHRLALIDLAGEFDRALKTQPDSFLTAVGRADAAESDPADLARRRADAVLAILSAQGVPARAMRAGGPDGAIPRGATPAEAAANRRVTIRVIRRDFRAEHRAGPAPPGGPSRDSRLWIDAEARRLGLPDAIRGRLDDLAALARDRGTTAAVDALAHAPSVDPATREAIRTILKGLVTIR